MLDDDEIEQSKEVEDDKQIPVTQPTTLQADDQSVFRPVSSGSHTDHDSSIWDSNEIAVLRQAFKATRDENALLCSQVRVLQDDVERMTMERCMQCGSLESTRQRLHQAETANQRLQMLVSHLKTELNRTTNKVDQLRLLAAERNDLTDQLQKMESELSSADYIRDRDVAAIEAKWTKILEEQQLVETETKMQLNNEIIKLVQRAEELEQLLGQEREDHSKARKGLEHLRVHFSSLPASDNKLNSVCKDQLPNWTYWLVFSQSCNLPNKYSIHILLNTGCNLIILHSDSLSF